MDKTSRAGRPLRATGGVIREFVLREMHLHSLKQVRSDQQPARDALLGGVQRVADADAHTE